MWLSSFAMYTIARPGLPKFFLLYSALFFHRRSLVVSKKMVIQNPFNKSKYFLCD